MVMSLLALLMYFVFLGLHGAWIHTFGYLFEKLAHKSITGSLFGGTHPLGFLDGVSKDVANRLLDGAQKSSHAAGYLFHGAAVIQGWIARELVSLSRDTLAWARWLQHVHLPKYVRYALYAAFPPALIARLMKAHALPRIIHEGKTITIKARVDWSRVKRVAEAAAAAAIGLALPGVHLPGRVRHGEVDLSGIKARLRRLERASVGVGAVALFAAAIAKLGLHWLRCKNVTKAGRAICRSDASWLESLLIDAVVIASAISVVTFAKELLAIEDEAVKILGAGIREFPG